MYHPLKARHILKAANLSIIFFFFIKTSLYKCLQCEDNVPYYCIKSCRKKTDQHANKFSPLQYYPYQVADPSNLPLFKTRTQWTRTGHLHTGKCIYWKYVVVAKRWLRFQNWRTYVEDWIIISPLFLCISLNFLRKKNNSLIYYLLDCIGIFIVSLSVFMNISKKPRYPFGYFRHF